MVYFNLSTKQLWLTPAFYQSPLSIQIMKHFQIFSKKYIIIITCCTITDVFFILIPAYL